MEKLIVLSEDGDSQEYPLTEQRVSIGREHHNVICLGDKSVSRHHATIQRVFRGFIIEDEGSTNGTRVNGRPITKQFLKHRDLIEIGKYHLRFLQEAPDQSYADADKTMVIRPTHQSELAPPPPARREPIQAPSTVSDVADAASAAAEAPAALDEASRPAEEADTARIRFLAGEQRGDELAIDRAFFSVGNPGGDLVLINKRHSGYYLLKVGGEVPPRINGKPIRAGGVELNDGDRIELGELSLEFRL